jgi:hypothetical protein
LSFERKKREIEDGKSLLGVFVKPIFAQVCPS